MPVEPEPGPTGQSGSGTAGPRRLPPTTEGISEAARILEAGGLVGVPSETVYGLACDATSDEAVRRCYTAKGRPNRNPLISHVQDFSAAESQGVFDAEARLLAEAFWPGPLTLVVPVAETATSSGAARAGLGTIALRVPAHSVFNALCRAFDRPIAAPSANRSGHVSPVSAAHVVEDLPKVDAIIDDGHTPIGLESSVVACTGSNPTLLRPGSVTVDQLETALSRPMASPSPSNTPEPRSPASPGLLSRHYAPDVPIRLNARAARGGETFIGFGPAGGDPAFNLSSASDLDEAAARLFALLRAAEALGRPIAVAPLPDTGLGKAINDRLRRAAAP